MDKLTAISKLAITEKELLNAELAEIRKTYPKMECSEDIDDSDTRDDYLMITGALNIIEKIETIINN